MRGRRQVPDVASPGDIPDAGRNDPNVRVVVDDSPDVRSESQAVHPQPCGLGGRDDEDARLLLHLHGQCTGQSPSCNYSPLLTHGSPPAPPSAPTLLLGQVGPLAGQVEPWLGQVELILGQVELLLGQVGPFAGQVGHVVGQVEHRVGQVGLWPGQVELCLGQVGL